MRDSIYKFTLDIHEYASQVQIVAKQNDSSRKMLVTLMENGKPYAIESGCTAVFMMRKPDGTILLNDCDIIDSGNAIQYEFTTQTTASEGICECEIRIIGEDETVITSPRFTILVNENVYDDGQVESQDEFTALTGALAKAEEFKNKSVKSVYIDGENVFTVEQVDGTKTTSTVVQDIVELVEGYANSASTSETNASVSANNANTYASQALGYKNAAFEAYQNTSANVAIVDRYVDTASGYVDSAKTYADLSESYAVGNGVRVGDITDNAKYYKEQCEQIAASLQGGFIPMGTVAFANLPTNAQPGWMYNIIDSFVSDSRFKDGGGKTYASGTNVYLTSDNLWDCLSGSIPVVNGKVGNIITLDGRDLLLDGYSKASAESGIAVTDNITVALGKLEKKADNVPSKINTALASYVAKSDIQDNLTSTDSNKPLSANQGKVLKDQADIIGESVNDLSLLGWSVPYEMPIQNYIDANRVFHQRVGRIDLGSLSWTLSWGNKAWYTDQIKDGKAVASGSVANIYNSNYRATVTNDVVNGVNGSIAYWISGANKLVGVANGSTTEKPSGYLYYELATEITFSADGNEKIVSLEKHFEVNIFSVPHESLNLIPYPYDNTTKTDKGITFTVADNGEININGTNDGSNYSLFTCHNFGTTLEGGTYLLYGCASGGANNKYRIQFFDQTSGTSVFDYGDGVIINVTSGHNCFIFIRVEVNTTVNNLVFKPTLVKGTEIPNCLGWLNSSALVGKALGKNLLNPTLATTTVNGVTCTNNGDGTYTLNGTASATVSFTFEPIKNHGTNALKLVGCANGGSSAKYSLIARKSNNTNMAEDIGNGITFTPSEDFYVMARIQSGTTVSNLVFKPMLVDADLYPNVTYNDFEKWQGLTSADSQKYTKYAKIETDKYGADFIPQYVDYLPNGFCFTDSEQDDLSLLENGVHFLDDGILLLAESTPSTDVNLRIGGVV